MNTLNQQIEAAKNTKAIKGYTTDAVVCEMRLTAKSRKSWFSYRFEDGRNVGEVIHNQDGSMGIIRAIV